MWPLPLSHFLLCGSGGVRDLWPADDALPWGKLCPCTMSVPFTNGFRLNYFHLDSRNTWRGGKNKTGTEVRVFTRSCRANLSARRRRRRRGEEEEKTRKNTSLLHVFFPPVATTNHQFHTEPTTVPNIRPISIQAFLKPFGAFDALKGLIVPSSALL